MVVGWKFTGSIRNPLRTNTDTQIGYRIFFDVCSTHYDFQLAASSWSSLSRFFGSGLVGTSAGFVSGSAGIAGGNVIVPTLIFFNIPPHNATATSSFLGVPIALSGSLGYLFFSPQVTHPQLIGYVDTMAFISIISGSIIAAPIGVKIAHNISPPLLKKFFGGILILASTRMLIDAFSF